MSLCDKLIGVRSGSDAREVETESTILSGVDKGNEHKFLIATDKVKAPKWFVRAVEYCRVGHWLWLSSVK